jgi:hypothetical protein
LSTRNVVISPKLRRTLSAVRAVLAKKERQALDEIVRRGTGDDRSSGDAAERSNVMSIKFAKIARAHKADKAQVQAHALRRKASAPRRKADKAQVQANALRRKPRVAPRRKTDKQAQAHALRRKPRVAPRRKADKQAQAHILRRKPRVAPRRKAARPRA